MAILNLAVIDNFAFNIWLKPIYMWLGVTVALWFWGYLMELEGTVFLKVL